MIRINLLPAKKVKKKKKAPRIIVIWIFAMVLSVGGIAFLYISQRSDIKRLDRETQTTQAELERLKDVDKLVKQFENDKKELDRKITVISSLSASQKRPVRLLYVINRALPEDIWLSGVTTSDVNVKISGYALTNTGVAQFMTRLKDNPEFKSVDLVESAATIFERSTVYRFDLNCVLKS